VESDKTRRPGHTRKSVTHCESQLMMGIDQFDLSPRLLWSSGQVIEIQCVATYKFVCAYS
jgi:hypothetical protein